MFVVVHASTEISALNPTQISSLGPVMTKGVTFAISHPGQGRLEETGD